MQSVHGMADVSICTLWRWSTHLRYAYIYTPQYMMEWQIWGGYD